MQFGEKIDQIKQGEKKNANQAVGTGLDGQ